MAVEFGTGKTVFILAIVVGCFAVLWPKLFYPMLQASVTTKAPVEVSQATCCDVIFETDVNAIKLVAGLCESVLQRNMPLEGRLPPALLDECRSQVLKCGVDIAMFLQDNVRLGKLSRQLLDEIRSFNSSRCLMSNFGVHLGAPRHERLRIFKLPNHFRQERPPHLRPEMLHPALRERGRAIPQSHVVPWVMDKEARPPPIPGMRPPMGGAGHVVPAPKTGGTMGIIMPIYTIGIVVFFMYTIMKMMFKKPSDGNYGADPQFRKMVFEQQSGSPCYKEPPVHKSSQDVSKLVVTAISGLLAEVDLEREKLARRESQKEEEKLVYSAAVEELPTESGGATEQQEPIGENVFDLQGITDEDELQGVTDEDELRGITDTDVLQGITDEDELQGVTDADVLQGVTDEDELQGVTDEDELQGVTDEDELQGITDADVLQGVTEPVIANLKRLQEITEPVRASENELQGVPESTSSISSEDIEGPKVQVVNMETTASGQRWSRPSTPVSRSATPLPPMAIFLEGALPSQSQLLVADSRTQQEPGVGGDAPVVLSGKMTLSLISLDTAGLCEDICTHTDAADEQLDTLEDNADKLLATTGDDSDETADRQLYEDEDATAADEQLIKVEDTLLGGDEFEEDINTRDYQPPVPKIAQHRAPARTDPAPGKEEEDEEEEDEEEEEEDEEEEDDRPCALTNATSHGEEDPTTTNYTTASPAAEATSATGPEETAADLSALESIDPDNDQEDEDDQGPDEEVWNGDIDSGESQESEEEQEEPVGPGTAHR